MEKVLTILGVIVLLMIIYFLFSKRAKRFILKFLNYKILIIKGTTNFINKYREDICVYIKHNFEKEDYTTSSWIQNVIVHVGDSTYTMGNESRYEITGLIGDTTYKVYFEYKVVEPSTGNVYQGLDQEFEVKTLNFELPKVESFEIDEVGDNYVKIKYQYEDSDDAVVGASIIYGNSKYDLTRKRGTVKIEGLDLSSQGYEFYLQLLYYEEEGSTFAKEVVSETLKVEQKIEEEIEQPKKGCKKTSAELVVATISVLSLATFVIRKKHD